MDSLQSHFFSGEKPMTKINPQKKRKIVNGFKNKRILVLGDLMMDKYIWGDVSRISPEAPIPVVVAKNDTSCLGGAGNVSHNIQSLGASPILTGVVGRDKEGDWIRKAVLDNRGIFVSKSRPTTVKTRIIAHQQHVVRVDMEEKKPISSELANKLYRFIQQEKFDALIISDYNKGLLSESLLQKVLAFAQQENIPVCVDPKAEHFLSFSPITLITPNHLEAERVVHHACLTDEDVEKAGNTILSQISTKYLILKRGEQGLSVFERNKKALHVPTLAKEVYDVTGAGDTVIAVSSLALVAGASIQEAALLANIAAGIVVGKLGTATLNAAELIAALQS
jgi:D-beta-D-heptose 7-phosphate kinase/D-beta-D-heptose 1-phosphate adenosyltransferase